MNSLDAHRVELALVAALVGLVELSNLQRPAVHVHLVLALALGLVVSVTVLFCKVLQVLRQDPEAQVLNEVVFVDGERISQLDAMRILALVPDNLGF